MSDVELCDEGKHRSGARQAAPLCQTQPNTSTGQHGCLTAKVP